MAYNKYVRFYNNGSTVEYAGVSYSELYFWGEYVQTPLLTTVDPASPAGSRPGAVVVIDFPNDPRIYLSFFRQSAERGGRLTDQSWDYFSVDNYRYEMDSAQVSPDGSRVRVTGYNGEVILPA